MKILISLVLAMLFSGSSLADEFTSPDITGEQARYLFQLATRHATYKTNPNIITQVSLESACLYTNTPSQKVQLCAVPDGYMNQQDAKKVNQIVKPFITIRADAVDRSQFKNAILNYTCIKESSTEYSCWIERH